MNGAVTVSPVLGEDDIYICYFFNILEPDDGGAVFVNQWRCPLGVPEDAALDDYEVICAQEHDDVEFTLDHAGGSFPETTANGDAAWMDLPVGDFTIQETLPPGFRDPMVFCGFSEIPGDNLGVIGLVPAVGGLLNLTIPADGYELTCAVFNIPDDGNSLSVIKWRCPPGFDVGVDDPDAECTEPMGGVTFTLDDQEATTGDDQGVAVFEDVPSGDDYELTEILPESIAYAWVSHCALPMGTLLMPLSDEMPPVVFLDFGGGDHWTCHWYNVPEEEEENSITIRKWMCPESASHEETQGWYEGYCIQQHNDVLFSVASDIGVAATETVGGAAVFAGLPAGAVGIQEHIPSGYGEPVVFC